MLAHNRLFPLVQHLHCSYLRKPICIALFVRSLEIPLLWMETAQNGTNPCHIPITVLQSNWAET